MKRILIFLNYLAVFALLLAYLAPYIDPNIFWPIALFGLGYPFLLIANLIFVLFWLIRRKKFIWISLLTIILGWNYVGRYFQFGLGGDEESTDAMPFNLVCYNVRLFDLYNWKNAENTVTRDKVYKYLSSEASDILCLQEYYSNDDGYFSTVEEVMEVHNAKHHQIEYTVSIYPSNWGIAIFSKHPIINRGRVDFKAKSNNICVFADIVLGTDTVRVYNAHLGSIHFGYEEYDLLEKVGKSDGSRDSSGPEGTSNQIRKAENEDVPYSEVVGAMVKLLRTAFVNRAEQARAVADHAATSPHPVIICGDINDTPV
ncbi:MAG: hypothetical protein JKX73_07375, partial [Flavobacteriales bacterium]|nr:hypothetical protein [Flavobacteriales bacterium]